MSKKVQDFVQQVNKQNFSEAKGSFESAIAEKISAAFENKKIELASQMTEGTEIAEAKKHSHDFEADMFGGLDAKLSRGDTVDLKGLEVDDMNTSSYKKFMEDQLGRAAKNVKAKVDRTGMASLSFEVVDPNKVKSVLQDNGIMEWTRLDEKKSRQMVEGRNKPDLQRDIGYWAIEKDTGQIYSGPYEKRKDAKNSAVHLVRGGKRRTPNVVVKFGTVDRTGKFKEL